jgi:hypothetical protein
MAQLWLLLDVVFFRAMEGDILKLAHFDTGGDGIKFHEPGGHQQG